ncbi:MAG: serine hydrolase, partial [Candidatus Saccharibacteria bacterium]|nr:serine hydrolase [Rhodoferax sp.]
MVALLKLVDEGQAKLDDSMSKYLPDHPQGKAITLHQLLNHPSGIKSDTSAWHGPRLWAGPSNGLGYGGTDQHDT